MQAQVQKTNWGFITRSILDEKSILFLGPDITINYQEPKREADFLASVAKAHPRDIEAYHDRDGFLVFKESDGKEMYLHEIQPFYERDFSNPLLEKLADLPFHLIISLTPDLSINKIFERKNYAHTHGYFARSKSQLQEQPSADKPLVYNLLGCIKDIENTVITHQDLFSFIQALYAEQSLPDVLLNAFNKENSRNVIFLGFDFSKWYFQLLLHLLRIQNIRAYTNLGEFSLHPPYDSHFNIQMIDTGMEEFVEKLYEQFPKEQRRKSSAEANKPERKYLEKNIFRLLNSAFVQGELETFCMLNYEEVYDEFSPEQSRTARMSFLMQHVKKQGLFDELLELLAEENPFQFEKHAPYYEEI